MSEKNKKNRLFLLDGMALIYRAHFAFVRNPIVNSQGQNTSAIYGFTNTLLDILENHNPSHLGVAFDTKEPTPRHEIFPEYKAQREAMPEDLAVALPEVKRLLKAFNIPVIELPGYEADDLIGTLVTQADSTEAFDSFMVTPDKDFAQLVSDHSNIWKPGRKGNDTQILNKQAILEQWEIKEPKQVIDILGLWGDASDNIPGVPGIGEKTAKKLMKEYDSIEGLLANTDKLKGKQKENVENNKEQALLSKKLVTILLDAPIEHSVEDLKLRTRDEESLRSLMTEWEFNSLGKRLFGKDFSSGRGHTKEGASKKDEKNRNDAEQLTLKSDLKTHKDLKKNYTLIDTPTALKKCVKQLEKQDQFCFDLETTSLNPRQCKLLGVALSWQAHHAYFISCNAKLSAAEIYAALEPILTSSKTKIGHNLKYDLSVLESHGVASKAPYFDTMLAHCLTYPEQKHNMDYVSESLLGYTPISLQELNQVEKPKEDHQEDLFSFSLSEEKKEEAQKKEEPAKQSKKKNKTIDMERIPQSELAQYASEDADVTYQLAELLAEEIENQGHHDIFYTIEMPLLPALVRMENAGIAIQPKSLLQISKTLETSIRELKTSVLKQAGTEFNLNSPKQLGDVLFNQLQLVEKPKKTKTGQYKTDETTLRSLAPKHQIVADLLSYREASKLKSTYVDALPTHQCPSDQRIHSHFHQVLTATGRLASSDPNLQNIPIRTPAGREIRKAFIPSKNSTLLSADYSQVELRVMAAMSGDQAMINAFKENQDIHSATAARVYGVGIEEVTQEMRSRAKMVNFGIIYGISAFGLSQRLNIPRGEAKELIETYFEQYPAIKSFMEKTIEQAREQGYVSTLSGRKRQLRDINSRNGSLRQNAERAAINTPIQGTAADMIKLAMLKVDDILQTQQLQSRLLLQVHDELIVDLHESEAKTLKPQIKHAMETALPLPHEVPLKVDVGTGTNWLEAH